MGVTKLFVGEAVRPSDRPTGRKLEREPQKRDVEAPSLPRGNRLVARTKTSPGSGRSSSPSRVTPVALSRSQHARYSGGAAPDSHRLPYPRSRRNYWFSLGAGGLRRNAHTKATTIPPATSAM